MRRWGILISGRGSNLGALLDLRDAEIDIRLVLSSNPEAYGLCRAQRAGVPSDVIPKINGTNKLDWVWLDQRLRQSGVTHVFLAGFMKIVPAKFIEKWRGKILNLHPSLLPAYPGLNSIERAFDDHAPMGVTVHEVNELVDGGKIIAQRVLEPAPANYGLAEFLIHVAEQRTVKEAVVRWI